LAAARLGAIHANLRDVGQAQKYLKQAFAHSDSLSEPERLFIKSAYHYIVTGRLDDVVATSLLWIATYPDDWVPHNNLSTTYLRMNQLDGAADEGRTAVKLAPTSVVAYQQLTRALLAQDQVAEAKELIGKAATDGLDSSAMRGLAFDLAFVDKDGGVMQEHLRAAATRQDGYLVVTEAARAAAATGDVDTSRTLYARAIAAGRAAHIDDFAGSLIAEEALNDALAGDLDRARGGIDSAIAISHGPETTWTASLAAAFAGQASRAAELAKAYEELQPPAPDIVNVQTPMLHAAIALAGKDAGSALAALSAAGSYDAVAGPWLPYLRGLAEAGTNDAAGALAQFRNIVTHPASQPTSFVHSLAHLQLARAARDAGETADARKAYADFSALMRSARPTYPLLAAANREAAALPAANPAPTR
jgi:hypothetical protein